MPSGMESLSYNVSQIFILRFINLMGTAVIATKVYASMLANVAYVYSIAVAQATQIILGYLLGGRKLEEVSPRVWSTIRIALMVSELLTLVIFFFCDPIYSIFYGRPGDSHPGTPDCSCGIYFGSGPLCEYRHDSLA